MSRKIYKYRLDLVDEQKFPIPSMYPDRPSSLKEQVLYVATQADRPCLWVLVDTQGEVREQSITMIGTGDSCDDLAPESYLGSSMLYGGSLVFHFFSTYAEGGIVSKERIQALTESGILDKVFTSDGSPVE